MKHKRQQNLGKIEWKRTLIRSVQEGSLVVANGYVLLINGRTVLHALALSDDAEAVSPEDRKLIGTALAEYLSE